MFDSKISSEILLKNIYQTQVESDTIYNSKTTIEPEIILNVIVDNEHILLTEKYILDYLKEIGERINVTELDLHSIVKNVYPKLKSVNEIKDIEDQIISCVSDMMIYHENYQKIAVWILIQRLHQNTSSKMEDVIEQSQTIMVDNQGKNIDMFDPEYCAYVIKNADFINNLLDFNLDYQMTFFGYRTLEKSYLKKRNNGDLIERPQHLWARVAIALHYKNDDKERIIQTYHGLSQGYYTHATPTLFNAGTTTPQMSSCFLMHIEDDTSDIGNALRDCMLISKNSGGIGACFTGVRTSGSLIKTSQGRAGGLKVLKSFNEVVRFADQGGKRPGSIAAYIEPWHGDIDFFLKLRKNTGAETERARDIFLGLMVNDVFMERVKNDQIWSLMCPVQCPKLVDAYGSEFTKLYNQYEADGSFLRQISARALFWDIIEAIIETGGPYILFKDSINTKSGQKHIGTVKTSNLCAEIVEVVNPEEDAVCNLASICLPKFVTFDDGVPSFDYLQLYEIARQVCRNLNNVIDINYYPTPKTRVSNMRNRPIGTGIQGLADVFALFRTPFGSELSRTLNKNIMETIYYGCVYESMTMARELGEPYSKFAGSPMANGIFQFDMWGLGKDELSGMWDWDQLRDQVKLHGVMNSLLVALMPTASSSQIMGNNECFEPITENIYVRSTVAGDYYVVNKHLMKELRSIGMWNDNVIDQIKLNNGSIANIRDIPQDIKDIYRTAWEIEQMTLIEMSADRGPFVDQTQSLNIFFERPKSPEMATCLLYAWELGLKTGIYYLKSKASTEATQFGIDINKVVDDEKKNKNVCVYRPKHLRKDEDCMACSS
jgi:ribonucleoside-diphosphate reductase alpha subunit